MDATDRKYLQCRQRMNLGMQILFPLGMATIITIGPAEYEARTARYERYVNRVVRNFQRSVDGSSACTYVDTYA